MDAYDSIQKIRERADILIPLHDISVGRKKKYPRRSQPKIKLDKSFGFVKSLDCSF